MGASGVGSAVVVPVGIASVLAGFVEVGLRVWEGRPLQLRTLSPYVRQL